MRQIALHRLQAGTVTLGVLVGATAWQLVIHATGASARTTWLIASCVAVAAVVSATPRVIRQWSMPAVELIPRRMLGGAVATEASPLSAKRMDGWRFDVAPAVIFDVDEEQLAVALRPVLERALVEVLENPLGNPLAVEGAEPVRIKPLPPVLVGERQVPLLLAYAHRERLIQKLIVAPAAPPRVDRRIEVELKRLRRAAQRRSRNAEAALLTDH